MAFGACCLAGEGHPCPLSDNTLDLFPSLSWPCWLPHLLASKPISVQWNLLSLRSSEVKFIYFSLCCDLASAITVGHSSCLVFLLSSSPSLASPQGSCAGCCFLVLLRSRKCGSCRTFFSAINVFFVLMEFLKLPETEHVFWYCHLGEWDHQPSYSVTQAWRNGTHFWMPPPFPSPFCLILLGSHRVTRGNDCYLPLLHLRCFPSVQILLCFLGSHLAIPHWLVSPSSISFSVLPEWPSTIASPLRPYLCF